MNDDFFKSFRKTAGIMFVVAILGNLLFWGGLLALACWLVKHFFFNS